MTACNQLNKKELVHIDYTEIQRILARQPIRLDRNEIIRQLAKNKLALAAHDIFNYGNPFIIMPILSNDGVLTLSVAYPFVLQEGYRFSLNMNTIDALPIVDLSNTLIQGKNDTAEPVIVNDLEFDTDYHIEVFVRNEYGDDVVLKGMIKLLEGNEKPDYLFEGGVRALTIDGYEIKDYE